MAYQTHYKKGSEKRGQDLIVNEFYICYAPEWSTFIYEVCMWNGKEFTGDDMEGHIDKYVVRWSQFEEISHDV